MCLFVALLLAAWPEPDPVIRSREEISPALVKMLPADLDFTKEMLVGQIHPQATSLEVRQVQGSSFDGKDTWYTVPHSARCPCGKPGPRPKGITAVLWRLPRAPGNVYSRHEPLLPCEPCTSP